MTTARLAAHEAGHAVIVYHFGGTITHIWIDATGGQCRWNAFFNTERQGLVLGAGGAGEYLYARSQGHWPEKAQFFTEGRMSTSGDLKIYRQLNSPQSWVAVCDGALNILEADHNWQRWRLLTNELAQWQYLTKDRIEAILRS
jgi:hypothetical protein